VNSWGKRWADDQVGVQHRELVGQALRRTTKWEFNTMNSWGKRWADDDRRNWPKRAWSSDNSLRIWG